MDENGTFEKTLGLWVNEKKCKKFNLPEFIEECRKVHMKVVRINLAEPLEDQGPFDVVLHKITAMYAQALDGNLQARQLADKFEKYLQANPQLPVVDPVTGAQTLLHRPATYALLEAVFQYDDQVTTPPYVELGSWNLDTKKEFLHSSGLTFPIVCKPVFGCGGTEAHQMAVVLSISRLQEWNGPCVAQSFIQHGAVLFKLFVVGNHWHLVERPSLKNFRATDAPTVHFNSANVSKAGSCSPLNQLDLSDREDPKPLPDHNVFDRIVRMVKQGLGMELMGIDVVIDSASGKYYIIDVNPFPSYDSFPNLMPTLAQFLVEKAESTDVWAYHSNSSRLSDILCPIEQSEDGTELCPRTRDSHKIDLVKLLQNRGHLNAVENIHKNFFNSRNKSTNVSSHQISSVLGTDNLNGFNGSVGICDESTNEHTVNNITTNMNNVSIHKNTAVDDTNGSSDSAFSDSPDSSVNLELLLHHNHLTNGTKDFLDSGVLSDDSCSFPTISTSSEQSNSARNLSSSSENNFR